VTVYREAMIELLLSQAVSSREARDDDSGVPLFAEELALLGDAFESRRREFATARRCAHEALAALGFGPAPILRGAKREPLWPDGIVGSITHCRGYRAAAVAHCQDMLTIGIDAEPDEPMPDGIGRRVFRAEEREWLARAPIGVNWGRVIFSAKESIYKSWYPLTGRWLGFDEAIVTIDPQTDTFQARLLASPEHRDLTRLTGRFLVADGLVLTAVAVPRL
jgi:4'-phosphopantetheinyl transferase EntD